MKKLYLTELSLSMAKKKISGKFIKNLPEIVD